MNVNLITIPKAIAKREYQEYSAAIKNGRKEEYLEEMKSLNYYLKQGKKIIDLYAAFENTGLNHLEQPKLAICHATAKECFFEKLRNGAGVFREYNQTWGVPKANVRMSVRVPEDFFPDWEIQIDPGTNFRHIKNPVLSTKVPIVPARLLPPYGLDNYHIIWEVEEWQVRRAPVDPILVRRVSKNLFAVLAVWDLTPLEKALVEGRE